MIWLDHFKLISKHKIYVYRNCKIAGITWRGIKHDLSKYSPTEFFESVKYFTGNGSPIDKCKKEKGYSLAWLHHKGRNRHHWEYWVDGETPIKMPFEDACELICDYIGAGEAYMGKNFSFEAEYFWWQKKKESCKLMHPHTKQFVDDVLFQLTIVRNKYSILDKYSLKRLYNNVGRNVNCQTNYTMNNQ